MSLLTPVSTETLWPEQNRLGFPKAPIWGPVLAVPPLSLNWKRTPSKWGSKEKCPSKEKPSSAFPSRFCSHLNDNWHLASVYS